MRELPKLNTERLQYTQEQIEKVFRFETPDEFPFFGFIVDHDVDAADSRFADAHMVERQLKSWRDWDQTLDESLKSIEWWNTQTYFPLQWPPSLHFSCPQEAILTPFGVKYRVFDDGSIEMDWREPVVSDLVEGLKRLENMRDGWLERALLPELFDKVTYHIEQTGRQLPISIPDWQSPMGLAAKLVGTTRIVYAMMEEPDKLRKILDFCADIMIEFIARLEDVCGRKDLVQAGMCQPRGARGIIFDDYISITPPYVFKDLAVEPNDNVLGYLGGGEIHTCGPCMDGIAESFMAHKHITSFDFFFAAPDKTRTTVQLRELKKQCRGSVVLNVLGMVFDEENFTPDFVNEMQDGGGVIFSAVAGSEGQINRWNDIIRRAVH